MPIPKLDPAACARRNLAAALEGRNAAPMRLAASVPPPTLPPGSRLVTASGSLPASDAEAVRRINDSLGLTGTPDELPPEKVLLVYPEVANRNYIPKYSMFLGLSTLRNIAARGADGIALMNSHRTGGMSTPTELPYGRTFCSRLETMADAAGNRDYRVILGGYMVAGLHPNGANGPSTDELHASIVGGTLNEVSLGFASAGTCVCDVCGRDMDDTDDEGEPLCNHCPGTHRGMDPDQVRAQAARGVPDGVATFTVEGADVNELSAVYSGALAGAGFRRTRRMARKGQLSAAELDEARCAFAPLLAADRDALGVASRRDSPRFFALLDGPAQPPATPPTKGPAVPRVKLADAYRFWEAAGRPDQIDLNEFTADDPPAPARGTPPGPAAANPPAPAAPAEPGAPAQLSAAVQAEVNRQVSAIREEFQRLADEREQERAAGRLVSTAAEAERWSNDQIRLGRATAAERPNLVKLYAQAVADDDASPVQLPYMTAQGQAAVGGRLEVFKAGVELRPARPTGRQLVVGHPEARPQAAASAAAGAPAPGALPAQGPYPVDRSAEEKDLDDVYNLGVQYARRVNGAGAGGARGISGNGAAR